MGDRERSQFLSTMQGHREKVQTRRRALTIIWTLTNFDFGLFRLQNCDKKDVCCLIHTVCGILLWQPKLIPGLQPYSLLTWTATSTIPCVSVLLAHLAVLRLFRLCNNVSQFLARNFSPCIYRYYLSRFSGEL